MDGFKKLKSMGILLGVILVVFGFLLLVFPEKIVNLLAVSIGILVLIFGGLRLMTYFANRRQYSRLPRFGIVANVIVCLFGIYILMNPGMTTSFICVVIGLFAIASAFDRFSVATQRRQSGLKIGSTLLFGVIHLLFGLLMIAMPVTGASMILMVAGIYLMAAGIMVILSTCYFFDL